METTTLTNWGATLVTFQRFSESKTSLLCLRPPVEASTLSMDENGGAWSWGYGVFGQLGTGKTSNQHRPKLVPSLQGMGALLAGGDHSLAFPQEGGLLVFGSNNRGQLGLNHTTNQPNLALSHLQPAMPRSTTRIRKKSAAPFDSQPHG